MHATQTDVGQVAPLVDRIKYHLRYSLGKALENATSSDMYKAVGLAVREFITDGVMETEARYDREDAKRLYYLSMEFLIGRSLGNNLHNLGIFDVCRKALEELGIDLEEIQESEADPALGNGGLGRLAACFLDSLATKDMPAYGYGINYEFGLFKQEFLGGQQHEKPDHWLLEGTPWQIERADEAIVIPLYGRLEHAQGKNGGHYPMWLDWKVIIGVPHDMPVVGYGGKTINTLRLYSARSSDEFDMGIFNDGDYMRAVKQKIFSETVSKVLYPADSVDAGKELRLVQEYFLVACTITDILRRFKRDHVGLDGITDKVAIQLNDTHPALAVAELMRALIDENDCEWDQAWKITQGLCGYTNHTLLPEALETWSVSLFERVLPRHLQIIYEINHRFLGEVAQRFPGDAERLRNMSIISEDGDRQVRMANLAIVGSHSVNGVAKLHSNLVKSDLVPDFHAMWPERFNNKTNGVTQRRWLLKCNPMLASLITGAIGDEWITDLSKLRGLEAFADDAVFQKDFMNIKHANKGRLAELIHDTTGVKVDPASLFDIQAKRMHEYKRQLLNVMHIIHQYLTIVEDGKKLAVPRTYVFAGKAAPGYFMAKLVIRLINNLADVINNDVRVGGQMKVVLIPDYRVSVAEKIMPAADVSEQISTAGLEASGTGNMKFAMNGALTIGTLDGANVELREEVGADNIHIFGLRCEEIAELKTNGTYDPWEYYYKSPNIQRVMDSLMTHTFCLGEPGLFDPVFNSIMHDGDHYFHLADLDEYIAVQDLVEQEYGNQALWARKAILNVARMGKFSSDRTIQEYADDIWNLKPVQASP